jgi:hypothetical protein
MRKPELTMNTVAEYHSFLNVSFTTYCDTGKESNHILAKKKVIRNLPLPIHPCPDTPLQHQNALCKNSFPLLFQKCIMSIFQEHFGKSQLIVLLPQH